MVATDARGSTPSPGSERSDPERAFGTGALGLIVVAALLRLGTAATRFLQVDEFQLLHLGWLRADGSRPGIDHFVPQQSLLIDLLEPGWAWLPGLLGIAWGRALAGLAAALVVVLTALLGRRLWGPTEGLAAALCLSLFSSFNDRAIEVRADVFLAAAMAGAWLALRRPGRRGPVLAGLLGALLVGFSFKSLLALPFLAVAGLGTLGAAAEDLRRSLDRLGHVVLGGVIGALALTGWLWWRDDLALWSETLVLNLLASSGETSRIAALPFILQSVTRNPVFYLLAVAGAASCWRRLDRAGSWSLLALLAWSLVYVVVNPTFYPYNFVDVGPAWALPAGAALAGLARRGRHWLTLLVVVGLGACPLARQASQLVPSMGDQLRLNRFVESVTSPDERVYDASGLVLRRRGPFRWRLHSLVLPAYRAGQFSLTEELQRHPCRLVVHSYRTEWLEPVDAALLERAFPRLHSRVGVAGWLVKREDWNGGRARVVILSAGDHELASADAAIGGQLRLDGEPLRPPVRLEPGVHELTLPAGVPPPDWLSLVRAPPQMREELDALPRRLELFHGFER